MPATMGIHQCLVPTLPLMTGAGVHQWRGASWGSTGGGGCCRWRCCLTMGPGTRCWRAVQALQLRVPATPAAACSRFLLSDPAAVSLADQDTRCSRFQDVSRAALQGSSGDISWLAACQGAVEMRMWAASEAQERAAAAQPVLGKQGARFRWALWLRRHLGERLAPHCRCSQQATGIAKEEPGAVHPCMCSPRSFVKAACLEHATG